MAKLLERLSILGTALLPKGSSCTGGLDLIRVWLKSKRARLLAFRVTYLSIEKSADAWL